MTKELTNQQINDLLADQTLDEEQGEADHNVPEDLLELFEVLEFQHAKDGLRLPGTVGRSMQTPGTVVLRAGWGARSPRGRPSLIDPLGCTFHYEGPRMGSFPHESCASKVRGIQAFHMDSRGWVDIAYNFLVCPHGVIYEGRGSDVRSAANGTNAGNSSSHAICALTGDGDVHPKELFIGLKAARQVLMNAGTGARTWCHQDWKSTSCPGSPIFNWQRAGMPTSGLVQPPNPSIPPQPPSTGNRCGDPAGHPLLKRGATGPAVNHLQYLLQRTGSTISGDGQFGPATESAVRNFQTWAKLSSDGVAGAQTWSSLHKYVDGLTI